MRASAIYLFARSAIAAFMLVSLAADGSAANGSAANGTAADGSAATPARAKTTARWSVVSQPARLVNGSPVLFRVTAPKRVRSLSGNWLGHEIEFSFDAAHKTWFALAGVSLDTKPGTYPIELHAEISSGKPSVSSTASSTAASSTTSAAASSASATSAASAISFEKKIRIARQHYPRIPLTVPDRYTAPSPEDQREIEKDKAIKAEAFKTLTPEREWQGSFAPPVTAEISDIFGVERVFNGMVESTHQGLDFRVPTGTSVAAINRGRVILAQPLFFEGNFVVIDHGQGLLTLYLHLSKFLVKEGDEVTKGQPIALSGGTGRATGPHLHLAVRWQGVYLDPQVLLKMNLP
jgi:murein DD-endopeptidase MepM/ murein hydrolase activator NlpD